MDDTATATFLFTDLEGSTRLWESEPERMRPAMARHDALAREAVVAHAGEVVKMTGDGLHAAFRDAGAALLAALELQRSLALLERESGVALRVRCGLHDGACERRDGDYYGSAVNRAARIMSTAHGGQVLLSQAVRERLGARLPEGVALRDLGSVRLRDLARPERIYQVVHEALARDFPPLRSLEGTPNNLPHVPSGFVGRERELAEALGLLRRTRLLTVTGMGGLGKTRLALQAAAESLDDHPDGAWLVELGALRDPRRVAPSVASAMGLKEEPGRPAVEALERHVRDRALLVILDNCEHLLEACAELARRLLAAGARLHVLATSREPLRIAGETIYAIAGMALPEEGAPDRVAQSEAARLFVERAQAVRPGFALRSSNADAVGAICRALDGIPLAIEIAAARVRSLPVEEIAARVQDRFALLTSRDPTAEPRQRTLRGLIDWSHDLLCDDERALFRQLAVFESGCTLEAVENVCALASPGDILPLLEQLVDKSLVLFDDESSRYRMLETVRHYARERLEASGEAEAVSHRHFDFHLALALQARSGLLSAERSDWLSRLDAERENLLAAHAWGQHGAIEPRQALRLASATKRYWIERGLLELGQRVMDEALCRPGAARPDEDRCRALFDAGQLRYFMGRYSEARRDLEESLAIARTLGAPSKVAGILQPLGMAALGEGDGERARACLTEALSLARAGGDDPEIAMAANALGQLLRLDLVTQPAAELFEEAIRNARARGDNEMQAVALLNLAMISAEREGGRFSRAALGEALEIADALASQRLSKSALEVAAGLAALSGDYGAAARLYGAAEAEMERTGLRRDPADAAFLEPLMARCRERLGADAFRQSEREGRALAGTEAVGKAREWLSDAARGEAICR